jgi:hypothetical protein
MATDDDPRAETRRLIAEWRADPVNQKMMAEIAERAARLREKYKDADVVDLAQPEWMEWLSVHHIFERDRAKGRRQRDRYARKLADRAAGRPWLRNDPRARLGRG